MSLNIGTLAIALIALSPFTAAKPVLHDDNFEPCATSFVTTVTTTVTSCAPSLAISSVIQTSLANLTSTLAHGHHRHHHNSTTASMPSGSISIAQSTNTAKPTSTSESTSAAKTTNTAESTSTVEGMSSVELSSSLLTRHHRHHHLTSSLIIAPTTSTIIPTSTFALPNDCQHDNCLRQFIRHPEVTSFCAIYTTDLNTATAGLPDYVSQCHAEPSRISSACSCIVTGVSPISTAAAATTETNGVTPATTSSPTEVQTFTSSEPSVCPVTSIHFETTTLTVTFVSTITLDQVFTTVAGATTSSGSDLITTLTASGTSKVVLSTSSVREHRYRHGGRSRKLP